MKKKEAKRVQDKLDKIRKITWFAMMGTALGCYKVKNPKVLIVADVAYLVGAMAYAGLFGADMAFDSLLPSIPD